MPLQGIVLDDLIAIHDSPLRVLEPGEALDLKIFAGNPDMRCPVCGQSAFKDVAAELAGQVHFFDQPGHIADFEKRLR